MTDTAKKTSPENVPEGDDAPRDTGKDSPAKLKGRHWGYILKRAFRQFTQNQGSDISAALTYFTVLAIFPGILAMVSILALIGRDDDVTSQLIAFMNSSLPQDTAETLRGPIENLTSSPGAGWALVIGLAGAIWSASGYVSAFSRGLNRIYGVKEGRPVWKLRPKMLLVTVIVLVTLVIMSLLIIVSGPIAEAIGSFIGLGDAALLTWNIVKWPVTVFLAVFLLAVLYHMTPNVAQPRFRWVSPGAIFGLLVWALATVGFFFYAANFSNYDATYGSLGGVIIFLLWLFISNNALVLGAHVDAEIERMRELRAGIEAEYDLQLPVHDRAQIDKSIDAAAKDVLKAREFRLSEGNPAPGSDGDTSEDSEHGRGDRRERDTPSSRK
jgi:membrane protein